MSSDSNDPGREAVGSAAVRSFDKYVLVRKLAEGGMAEIFLAKQPGVDGFEKNVVIKRLLKHLTTQSDVIDMFRDEARLAAQLSHPHVVQILELGFTEGCYFIAMEYLPGEDFSTLLRTSSKQKKYAPTAVALKVVADAAAGLHYAHEFTSPDGKPLAIVHRDISPSNLFVSFSGNVKVLDFGIARAESRLATTTAGTVKGKYQYMSPEQASSAPVDRRTDVFALGVSLYEALTLRRAFARDTELAVLKAVLDNDYVRPRVHRPDLSPELEAIVVKAMAKQAADRYQSAADLMHAIEAYQRKFRETCSAEQLATWAKNLVGPERVLERTRIPTLEALKHQAPAAAPLPAPTPSAPDAPSPGSGDWKPPSGPMMPATRVTKPESLVGPPPAQPRRSPALLLGAGIGAGILLAVGAVKLLTPAPVTLVVAAQDSGMKVEGTPPVDAGAAPLVVAAVSVDAGVDPASVVDAGGPAPAAAVDAGTAAAKPQPVRPVRLDAQVLMAVVKRNAPAMSRCIELHKGDLAQDSGTIPLTVTIAGSGQVSSAGTPLGASGLGQCLEQRARALRFPAHVDQEVTVTIPFKYEVKR